jgi:hypothetical protein
VAKALLRGPNAISIGSLKGIPCPLWECLLSVFGQGSSLNLRQAFAECPGSDVHSGGNRLARVTEQGKYERSNKPRQLGYGAMVFIRQGIVAEASVYLSRAVTIAVRYSAVRRQFGGKDDKAEVQV